MENNTPLKIKVIIGSTRQNRFSEKPAHYIFEEAKKLQNTEVELLDLRDYPLPFYDQPITPTMAAGNYTNEIAQKWSKKIKDGDAFIIVSPEYNHAYPAVLKNALDWLMPEWNKKPVGFISYGSAGGARAVEQLRTVVIELQMLPIKSAIHIPPEVYAAASKEPTPANPEAFAPLRNGRVDRVAAFLSELVWAGEALKKART